jgi:hypothetical protein
MRLLLWLMAVALPPYVLAEFAARWWIRRRRAYYVLPPGLRLRLRIDTTVFPQLERQTRFDVNSDGERGDECPRSTAGLYRVLVAGGSQPEGYLLDQDTAWPGALQRLLEATASLEQLRASRVHVGSIARSGVGAEALDLILDRLLPRYPRLQLIILLVGASDVLRWLEQGAPKSVSPVRTADVFRYHPEGRFGWTPGTMAAGELLRRARRRWLRPVQVHERAGHWIGEARAMRARATEIRSSVPDPADMLGRFTHYFGQAIGTAKAHADRVLVVLQPWFDTEYSLEEAAHMWHGGAGQVWRENVTAYYAFDVCSRLMRLLNARATDVANALEVEHVDLMLSLEHSLDTYYDCFHLTPAGSRATAAILAAATLEQPLPCFQPVAEARADERKGTRGRRPAALQTL